jgi:hypothetical protein
VRRRHGIGGWCSHQRVTANLPVAGAAAAPRRRAPATLTAYVSMDEDLRKTSKEIVWYYNRALELYWKTIVKVI